MGLFIEKTTESPRIQKFSPISLLDDENSRVSEINSEEPCSTRILWSPLILNQCRMNGSQIPCSQCELSPATNYCNYSGRMFCQLCFGNGCLHMIPSHILKNGDFTKKMVAGFFIEEVRKLWNVQPVQVTARLIRSHPSIGKYTVIKRQYLMLHQVINSSSPFGSLPSHFTDTEYKIDKNESRRRTSSQIVEELTTHYKIQDEMARSYPSTFRCYHGGPFKAFEKMKWLRMSDDTYTMAEICNAALSSDFVQSLDYACKAVYESLKKCCLDERRRNFGDRCSQEVKCHECKSRDINGRPRKKKNMSYSISSERFSVVRNSISAPTGLWSGGITTRRIIAEEVQRLDREKSWISKCDDVAAYIRAQINKAPRMTMEEFQKSKNKFR